MLALVTPGPNITELSGKLGRTVFTKGRSGLALRTRVHPKNPKSADQTTVRNDLKGWSQKFRALTTNQITNWNNEALSVSKSNRLGGKYSTTGHKLYVSWNITNSLFNTGTEITDYFTPTPVSPIAISVLEALSGAQTISITTGSAVPANSKLVIMATGQLSAGVSNAKGKYRDIKVIAGGTTAGIQDFTTEYLAKFGTLTLGKKIFVKARVSNNDSGKTVTFVGGPELSGKVKVS
jgi:hypothetical protein